MTSMPDSAKTPNEPSMEEIIASISRIISEEKRPIEPVSPAAGEKTDILELTEVVSEDGSVRRVTSSPAKLNASSGEPGATASSSVTDSTEQSRPMPAHPDHGTEPRRDLGRERILSSAKSGAAAAAFAQLGGLPRERHRQGELLLGGVDRTLEDIVRGLLRPLLQTWLDEHLPGIVERLVREEIARVIGEAGLR
jgi:cell pole-organizing protein PopZ